MGQKMSVKAGDAIPNVVIEDGMCWPPKMVNVADACKGKKVRRPAVRAATRLARMRGAFRRS